MTAGIISHSCSSKKEEKEPVTLPGKGLFPRLRIHWDFGSCFFYP
jgi:hypothetical protein